MELWKVAVAGLAGMAVYNQAKKNPANGDYCPYATEDIALNTKNRNYAAQNFLYGPLNPMAPNLDFWFRLASVFKPKGVPPTQADLIAAKKALCGNCGVFDISPRMQKCLPPLSDADEYDRYALESGSVLGYCWIHHFKCASLRTCETWVVGGPISSNERSAKMSKKYGRGPKKAVGT